MGPGRTSNGAIYTNNLPHPSLNRYLFRYCMARRHQVPKGLTLVLGIARVSAHVGGKVRPCMATVCFEYVKLYQSWPGVHHPGRCAKVFRKLFKIFRKRPKEGITVTLQILFPCCPEILVGLWLPRRCYCFKVGHIHPCAKDPLKMAFISFSK